MSWFPTMDLRWIERVGNGPGYRVKMLQQRWEQRWGEETGVEEWRDIPLREVGALEAGIRGTTCIHRDCIAERLPLSQYCAVHVDEAITPTALPCPDCRATGRAIAAKGVGYCGICLRCNGTRYIWMTNAATPGG